MVNVDGEWNLVIKSPMGNQNPVLMANASGDTFTGTCAYAGQTADIADGKIDGDNVSWKTTITMPMTMTLHFETVVSGDSMSGTVAASSFGTYPVTGTRA